MKIKQAQIPEALLIQICDYFVLDNRSPEIEKAIIRGLEEKIDRAIDHDLYSKSLNTSLTAEEREAARKEYLDRKGIRDSFRWSAAFEAERRTK